MKRTTPPPPPALTVGEQRILAVYRAMDDDCKNSAELVLSAWVAKFPHRARPALRLVSGGAK